VAEQQFAQKNFVQAGEAWKNHHEKLRIEEEKLPSETRIHKGGTVLSLYSILFH
jgi:hypothetical protein